MESYLSENFGDVKPKNSSEEALQRWRKACWLVKNHKRRFRFTANLSKRFEAEAIRRSNQVFFIFLLPFSPSLYFSFSPAARSRQAKTEMYFQSWFWRFLSANMHIFTLLTLLC